MSKQRQLYTRAHRRNIQTAFLPPAPACISHTEPYHSYYATQSFADCFQYICQ